MSIVGLYCINYWIGLLDFLVQLVYGDMVWCKSGSCLVEFVMGGCLAKDFVQMSNVCI